MSKLKTLEELKKQNFISADSTAAINSYGEYFQVRDVVYKERPNDTKKDSSSIILNFVVDIAGNEIIANTTNGWSHIDFIFKYVE